MRFVVSTLVMFAIGLAGCERQAPNARPPVEIEDAVRTTAAPIDSMTRRVAGDLVPVELLCPPGQPPATWRPAPDVVAAYQRATLIVANGAEFETWVLTAPLPRSRVVRTAGAIDGELLVVPGETHSHGPEGEHAHDLVVGQTWIDPINAIAQAGAIAGALSRAFPEHERVFAENLSSLVAELESVHRRLDAIDTATVAVVAAERPHGYLARRYGWPTSAIGADPAGWRSKTEDLEAIASRHERAVLLSVGPPDDEMRSLLETSGIRVVVWETGAIAGDDPYISVLERNVERLEAAIVEMTP